MDLNHPLLALADDPPPVPSSYPQLQRLDRALLCAICKELFQAPVSVACGHSFCSLCIRGSLDSMKDKKCPSCGESISEGSIRRNRALEEMAEAWDGARPTIVELTTPKRPAFEQRERSGSGSASASRKRRRSGSASSDIQELTEEDQAPCPLCAAQMPIGAIPLHIDRGCEPVKTKPKGVGGNQKSDWKKVFSGATGKSKDPELKRITKPNYSLASPADLRALLTEHGVPSTGDKDALVARVQQWIVLYNANLDRAQPRALSALRAQLADAESARRRDREKGRDEAVKELGTKEGLERYAVDKRVEFERLRREIMDRDARRVRAQAGQGEECAIEVE
ncbi:E3 ubiquitin-protein ligase rad18 [Cryptotrichosporon argae]